MVKKISGQLNPDDLMTKYMSGEKTISDMEKLGFAAMHAWRASRTGLRVVEHEGSEIC